MRRDACMLKNFCLLFLFVLIDLSSFSFLISFLALLQDPTVISLVSVLSSRSIILNSMENKWKISVVFCCYLWRLKFKDQHHQCLQVSIALFSSLLPFSCLVLLFSFFVSFPFRFHYLPFFSCPSCFCCFDWRWERYYRRSSELVSCQRSFSPVSAWRRSWSCSALPRRVHWRATARDGEVQGQKDRHKKHYHLLHEQLCGAWWIRFSTCWLLQCPTTKSRCRLVSYPLDHSFFFPFLLLHSTSILPCFWIPILFPRFLFLCVHTVIHYTCFSRLGRPLYLNSFVCSPAISQFLHVPVLFLVLLQIHFDNTSSSCVRR